MNFLKKQMLKIFLKQLGTSWIKEFCLKYSVGLSCGVVAILLMLITQC